MSLNRIFLFLALACLVGSPAFGAVPEGIEAIEQFTSAVEVRADGSMLVTETIQVQALGREIKRGIFRDFPTTYKDPQGRSVRVPFDVQEVLRDGKPEPHFTEGLSNGVRLYIGDKDVFLKPGTYVYTIVYETDRQIGFFEDHDELYWNVTGNDWDFAIYEAKAIVSLPGSAKPHMLDGWVGYQGAGDGVPDVKAFTTKQVRGATVFTSTRILAPGEGLTIAMGFDKGLVAPPTMLETHQDTVWGVGALGLLLAYYLFAWNRVGRDPRGGAVVPLFEPPEGISAAGCRHIMRMGFDNTCFAAAVLSCAVKGALVVEEPKKRSYSVRSSGSSPSQPLAPDEAVLENKLFRDGDELVFKQTNHARVSTVRSSLQKVLKQRYGAAYFKRNAVWLLPGLVITLAGLYSQTVYSLGGEDGVFAGVMTVVVLAWSAVVGSIWTSWSRMRKAMPLLAGIVGLLLGLAFTGPLVGAFVALMAFLPLASLVLVAGMCLTNLVFFRLLRAYTVKGRQILDRIEGFKLFLSVAEKDRLDLLNPPEETPELFERFLPYALALGVEQRWSERFAEVLARAQADPDRGWRASWYHGQDFRGDRLAGHLGAGLGASLAGAVAASSRAPGSSSGFSGGGGSSGGGGGGGGGGGW